MAAEHQGRAATFVGSNRELAGSVPLNRARTSSEATDDRLGWTECCYEANNMTTMACEYMGGDDS